MSRASEIKRVIKAYESLQAHADKYTEVVRQVFPVGCEVQYEHGEHLITAIVVGHGYRSGMLVRGRTGKEYHMDASRFFHHEMPTHWRRNQR